MLLYKYDKNITLNPMYEIITYKIFVLINNVYNELTNYNVKDNDIALNDYRIDGYGISNYYYNDNLVTTINTSLAKDIYLTADYGPLEYKIIFHEEDIIFSIYYGEVMSVINDYTPIKKGYNFINWKDINGKNYFGDELFNFLDDIILDAKWEPKEFKLTLNYNQDNKPNELRNVLFNSKIDSLPKPVKKGHDFIGWFDNSDNIFIEGSKYLFDRNMELVAKWELTVYEVSFDMVRTGYTNPSTQFVSIYSPLTYPSSFITGEFAGWYDNPQYSGKPYDFTAPLSKDIKLYAKWNFTVNLFDDRTYPMLPLNNVSRNVEFRTLAGGEINIRASNTGKVIVGLLDSKGNVIDFVVKDIHSGIIEFNFIAEPNSVYRLEITRQGVYAEISFLKIQGNRIPPDGGIPSNG